MSPVETLLLITRRSHGRIQPVIVDGHVEWECMCSALVDDANMHENHVVAEQAKALQAWLISDEMVNALGSRVLGTTRARTHLAGLADLIGGTP